ncbi:MAG: DUF2723 domain-containing protein [Bacteroidales bacterium]|nr:DUF2723 domain-containing protein [Bacteroidales bacterium]
MTEKKFNLYHRLAAAFSLVVSAVTYLLTIEPSASFWDCGEFIASSYKLEVGHPPGNPMFQLIARFFTLFGDNMHAAVLVNAMSALCSALTIFFLYLTIVFFVKRLLPKSADGTYSTASAVAIIGSGLVGALVYCFSDTFWFSAVEGEVYAMSSLFTALVFWAMTRWYDHAGEPGANRWIVLIAFLMGISIGIHLLNLLAIPALVFMYYYRQREDAPFTFWEFVKIFLVGVLILGVVNFIVVPYVPKLAAYADLFFVNVLGLPYNTGAAFFMVAVLALCFWGIFSTYNKGKVFWNTALLCLTCILIGFSVFSVVIIRSCAKTPTNEYQPDNAFTLVRYVSREQYGSSPLLYGQYFDAAYDIKEGKYWAPLNGKYVKVDSPVEAEYKAADKMLFPRMWNGGDDKYVKFYETYMNGRVMRKDRHRKPTMGENLSFFFDYQLNWMYWRYFMWNFVGRQNEVHGQSPGDLFAGNWESGVKFIDNYRLGDQSDAPELLAKNKGKNHYYFLPLLLGLLGLFFQFDRDKRGCWLVFLMFFMTGIAIVIYLNQPPYQVRERDYAYAGSFYFFSVWCGMAVAALAHWLPILLKKKESAAMSAALTLAALCVPALMAAQNWDDHDRSNRRTAVELASNYLNSVGPNGILITHGDNDTFPVWYAQEVEDVRPDVRICNTSLLGTDWHIDQMKWAVNQSAPLPLQVGPEQYLYGTNEYVLINDTKNAVTPIEEVMAVFRNPKLKYRGMNYLCSRKIAVKVNKANAIRSGIASPADAERIQDEIVLEISPNKNYLTKPELFMLDLLSGYQWDRPIHMLNMGGDLAVGLRNYLEFVGYSYLLVPWRNTVKSTDIGYVDTEKLYNLMTKAYKWDAIAAGNYFIDYQNMYTHLGVMSVRMVFVNSAKAFLKAGETGRALEMLDKCREVMCDYPLDAIPVGFTTNDYMVVEMIRLYYLLGRREDAEALVDELSACLLADARFYLEFYDYAKDEVETCGNYIYLLSDTLKDMAKIGFAPDGEKRADDLEKAFAATVKEIAAS